MWGLVTLHEMLRNPIYKGERHAGRKRNKKRAESGPIYIMPDGSPIVVAVPALVSAELWQAAQHRAPRFAPRSPEGHPHLLKGRLTCPNGYTFTTVQNRREKGHSKLYDYYRCGYCNLPTNRHLEKCGITNIRRTDVDAAVWAWVQQLVTAEKFAQALDERQANSSGARAEIAERIAV